MFDKFIYPLSSGSYTIGPITLGVQTDPFFGRQIKITSKPAEIEVLPLPQEGKPADFSGLVGDFRVSAAAEPLETKLNEPIELKIDIVGEGNLYKLLALNEPDLSAFDAYDPEIKSDTTFHWQIIFLCYMWRKSFMVFITRKNKFFYVFNWTIS